ncbi:TlpA family protein disulfide reductase [Actinomycetospora lemnae]|uniref:TlpA disulfide reductase family protein n=1 Tax=Actinomycetospora lemnae TaxID=3019891 RepID=A0ABT5SYI7_9PSEU|nr:TlpA disulfide reductase family protein [Actinomycetospora sp. DW7H6]MDD7967776.1 TlpA disulfide reductase family protein [Actinomycetospora sp. DW7H6]
MRHIPGRRTRRLSVLLAVAVTAVLVGCGHDQRPGTFTFTSPGGQSRVFYDPPATRGVVPPIAGEDVLRPGVEIGTASYPGQVVVLNIWGSWCGPCRAETPELEAVARATAPLGVQFLGIDVRDDRDAAADFLRDRGVSYPSIYDPPGRSLLALRGFPRNVVPSTIVLDREGRVAAVFLTAVLAADIEPTIRRIATEPPASAGGGP